MARWEYSNTTLKGTLSSGAATLASFGDRTLGVTGTTCNGISNTGNIGTTTLSATSDATVGGTLGVTGTTLKGTLSSGATTLASAAVTTAPLSVARWSDRQHHPQGHLEQCGDPWLALR